MNHQVNRIAMWLTFISNKMGGQLLGLFAVLKSLYPQKPVGVWTFVCLLLLLGSFRSSAQTYPSPDSNHDVLWGTFSGTNGGTTMNSHVGGKHIATITKTPPSGTTFAPSRIESWTSGAYSGDRVNMAQVNSNGSGGTATDYNVTFTTGYNTDGVILAIAELAPNTIGSQTYQLRALDASLNEIVLSGWEVGQGQMTGTNPMGVNILYNAGGTIMRFLPIPTTPYQAGSAGIWIKIKSPNVRVIEVRKIATTVADAALVGLGITADGGDAPNSYGTYWNNTLATGGPVHRLKFSTNVLYLGSKVTGNGNGIPSTDAKGDNLTSTGEEDAVATFPPLTSNATTYSVNLTTANTSGNPATLSGWIDFNGNGIFDTNERAQVSVPNGATTATLNWTGLSGLAAGNVFARFRVASNSAEVQNPTGYADDGEVEDYQLCITPVFTTTPPNQTICAGEPVSINYATIPANQQVIWVRQPSLLTGAGNVLDYPVVSGSVPESFTYTATVGSGACASTAVTEVTVNPIPIVTPSTCSQTICSGEAGNITFVSSIPGSTIHWLRVEDNLTGTGDISEVMNTAGNFTYKIWATSPAPASCPSSTTITCAVVVNECAPACDLVAGVDAGASTNCITPNGSLTITYTGSGSYQYSLNGGANLPLTASPFVVSNLAPGSYTLVVTDTQSLTCNYSTEITIPGTALTIVAGSNSPICSSSTLALSATMGETTGTYTYAWTGPNGFGSSDQNPTLPNTTTAASGVYTVQVTDPGGCTASASTTVIVANQPSLTIAGGLSQTVCSGQSTTLVVSGDEGAPVSWINNLGQSGTGTPINFAGITNVSGQPETITYILTANAGSCSDHQTVTITINPAPALQVYPQQAVICDIEQTNLTATSFPNSATVSWTRSEASAELPPSTGSGTGTVSVVQTLPAGSYNYTFTATQGGCTSAPVTVPLVVNQ